MILPEGACAMQALFAFRLGRTMDVFFHLGI